MVEASQITEHLDVVGSDGQHVGMVDKLCVKLTKKDPAAQGHHHVTTGGDHPASTDPVMNIPDPDQHSPRDRHITLMAERGRIGWQRTAGYGRCSHAKQR